MGDDVIMSIQGLLESIDKNKRLYKKGKERIAKAIKGEKLIPCH